MSNQQYWSELLGLTGSWRCAHHDEAIFEEEVHLLLERLRRGLGRGERRARPEHVDDALIVRRLLVVLGHRRIVLELAQLGDALLRHPALFVRERRQTGLRRPDGRHLRLHFGGLARPRAHQLPHLRWVDRARVQRAL